MQPEGVIHQNRFSRLKCGFCGMARPGYETWTTKESTISGLDGVYTRMLRKVFNISWKSHTPNAVLYGNISPHSTTIIATQGPFCWPPAHDLLFWQATYGKRYHGRPWKKYPDVLCNDTGLNKNALKVAMDDRKGWRPGIDLGRQVCRQVTILVNVMVMVMVYSYGYVYSYCYGYTVTVMVMVYSYCYGYGLQLLLWLWFTVIVMVKVWAKLNIMARAVVMTRVGNK